MVFGEGLQLPNILLLVLHVVGFVLGVWLFRTARRGWPAGSRAAGVFFGTFALSELLYLLARLGIFAVSLAQQASQVLLLAGAIIVVYSVWQSSK